MSSSKKKNNFVLKINKCRVYNVIKNKLKIKKNPKIFF